MNTYTSASLYVGDLHPSVQEAVLYDVFKEIGPIVSIRVCRHAETRKSLGYAYVNFQNPHDAERALDSLNFSEVCGKPIRIMWSQRDPSLRKNGVGNIFIKNLHKTIDNKTLYDTFSVFGNILSCKVSLNEKGESNGYGFVHFEGEESAQKAISTVNGKLIMGNQVYVGKFMKKKPKSFTNVYVKNLPEDTNDEELDTMFSKCGKIISAAVNTEEGKCTGFGFVNFEKHEEAKKAIEMYHQKMYNGNELIVCKAMKKDERKKFLAQEYEKLKREKVKETQGKNLYVKNLSDDVDEEGLRALFTPFGKITSCKVMSNEKGESRCFGFVCFDKTDEASKAIAEMNNKMIASKPLYVGLAQSREDRSAILRQKHRQLASTMNTNNPMMGSPTVFFQNNQQYPMRQNQRMIRPVWASNNNQYPNKNRKKKNNYKFSNTARNRPEENNMNNVPQNDNSNVGNDENSTPIDEQLTPSYLANCTPKEQKQIIGERLYPLVHNHNPELAGKITGMLLEMDVADLLLLLESPDNLLNKINEAISVLKYHHPNLS